MFEKELPPSADEPQEPISAMPFRDRDSAQRPITLKDSTELLTVRGVLPPLELTDSMLSEASVEDEVTGSRERTPTKVDRWYEDSPPGEDFLVQRLLEAVHRMLTQLISAPVSRDKCIESIPADVVLPDALLCNDTPMGSITLPVP